MALSIPHLGRGDFDESPDVINVGCDPQPLPKRPSNGAGRQNVSHICNRTRGQGTKALQLIALRFQSVGPLLVGSHGFPWLLLSPSPGIHAVAAKRNMDRDN